MQEQCVALKWGDIVRIHGVNLSKKKDTKGLIISKGFTDTNIYYQTYKQFSDVNFYRQSLFQILPRVNFDMHDQLLDDNTSEEIKENLRSRVHSEVVFLQNSLAAKAGKQIKYGSEVIFRHVQSKSYVFGMQKAANSGEGAFRIEVSQSLSSFVIFKLVSPRTFQNENDKVYYNDALQIYHPKSDSFMNFSQTQEPIYLDTNEQKKIEEQNEEAREVVFHRPNIKKPNDKRTFIMNENKSKCLWKFIEHCSYGEYINKEKIKSHDIVYFKHTKKGEQSLISTSISEPITCYLKMNLSGNVSYECFWELIPKQVNQFGPEQCNLFWARNIVTGQLLQFNDFNVEITPSGKVEGRGFDNRGLINLICSEATIVDKQVIPPLKLELGLQQIEYKKSLPQIQSFYESKSRKFTLHSVETLPKDIFMIYKVDEEVLHDAMYVISAHQCLIKLVEKLSSGIRQFYHPDEDQFYPKLFEKFQQEELGNIVNIEKMLAGKIYGTDYDNIVASGNTPNKTVQQILVQSGIVQILIQVLDSLYQPFRFIVKNDKPSDDRAIRMKITEIFQYTYRLIEKIAANFEENRIYISRWVSMFLKHSNNVNKSYIQQCLVGILRDNPQAIRATINKDQILNLIQNFFRDAEQSKQSTLTTKYLRLFSTFIVCENSVIEQNQNIILQSFFKHPKSQYNLRFKVQEKFQGVLEEQSDPYKVKTKQVTVSLGKQPFVPLVSFFQIHKNKWNYLMAYVNLLADICKDRNNLAIQHVSSTLSLQAIATILFSNQVLKLNELIKQQNDKSTNGEKVFPIQNVHEPFIRIAHHVYVDSNKFEEIKRIKRISQWYTNQQRAKQLEYTIGVEEINRTKRKFEGEKEQQEKNYLQSILEYIKNYIKNCNQANQNLNMLNIVLSLLKSTVILGLWKSIRFFRELAPDLMLKITKIQNSFFFEIKQSNNNKTKTVTDIVAIKKQRLKMNRPEIALGIQCKIKAIEIFKYMYDLEIDIRLRYMMNFFKGLYLCTQNFNQYDNPYDDKPKQGAGEEQISRNQFAEFQYFKMQGKALLGDSIKKMPQDVDIILKENVWLNKLNELTPFKFERTDDPMKDRYMFQGEAAEVQKKDFQKQFNTIVLGLFELTVYEDYKILNSSINMLRIMFQQRKDLLSNFKKNMICGKGNLKQVYLTLKFMRGKFNMLASSNIKNYVGDADKTFPYEIKKPYDYLIKDREKRSGIIEDLFFLTRTLKEGTSLKNIQSLMWVEQSFFTNQVYNFINEKQRNNPLFQSLNLAEGIYIPLFEYIKIIDGSEPIPQNHQRLLLSIYQYLTLLCFNNLQAKQILMPYIPYVLPHLKQKVGAASFLYEVSTNNKLLVSNEQLVSLIIQKSLESCYYLQRNLAVMDLLLKNFLGGQCLMKSGSQDASSNDYQRSRILYALRGVLIYNNQGHKKNQQLLMNRLQDNKYNRLIFQGTINSLEKEKTFILSGEQTYIVYAFELFSVLVESGNMINIGKLENLHPYEYCLDCLQGTSRWQIRRALRAYINRLYYVNKDKDIFLFEKFVSKQFGILNKQLKDLVQLHLEKGISQNLKIKNGIRFSYAQSIIFLYIIQCLITLHEMFLKPGFIAILRRELAKDERNKEHKKLHDSFIQLFMNLGCINKIYHNVKIISPFMNEVKRLMIIELERMPVRYLQKKSQPVEQTKSQQQQDLSPTNQGATQQNLNTSGDMDKKSYMYDHSKSFFRNLSIMLKFLKQKQHMDKLKQQYQKGKKEVNVPEKQLKLRYLETIFKVQHQKHLKPYYSKKAENKLMHYDPHLQTANSRIFKVLAKPELEEDKQNIQLNNNLFQVKNMIEDSPVFDKFKDDQFIFFVNTATALDQTSTQQYSDLWTQYGEEPKPVISLNQVFTKIFKLIRENPDKIDDQQKIFVVKMVRIFITQSVQGKQSYKLPVDKWDADYCQANDALLQRQQQIQKCGGSDFIMSIFKQNLTGRVELLNQILLLGIAYLFGGNHVCQNSLLDCLTKDTQNVMMINMKNLIKNIGEFLINIRKIKQNEKKRNFAYNIVDTYDYFNPEDRMICKYFSQSKVDKFEVQIQLDNEKALCRIFRFLQLFCENNNISMKRFLSTQINQDSQPKTNTINFVEQACNLLKKLFKIMNSKLVMIPNNLLAFVGQVTQVPILQNQISFIKSTFFEDISYMASFFDSPENKLQRKFNISPEGEDDPLNTLSQIYRQAIGLALGNFQGNQQIIIKQFLNKCQSKLMWLIIRDELWALIKDKYTHLKFYVADDNQIESRKRTFKNLDFLAIREIINEEKKYTDFDGPIVSIIQVLIILRKIDDFAQVKQKSALADRQNPNLKDSEDAKRARDFKQHIIEIAGAEQQFLHMRQLLVQFDNLILGIEVLCENGKAEKLQYIYFPKHPVFQYLAATTRDAIMVDVVRDTSRDKLISLLNFREEVYNEIKWNYQMNFNTIKGKSFPITSDLCENFRKAANICSYIIIVFMFLLIIAEHEIIDEPTTYFTYQNKKSRFFLKLLCFIQLVIMLLYAGLWYILRGELIFKKYLKSLEGEGGEESEGAKKEEGGQQELNLKIIPLEFIQQRQKELSDESITGYKKLGLVIFVKLLSFINWSLYYLSKIKAVASTIKFLKRVYNKIYNSVWLRINALFLDSQFKSIMFFLVTSILGNLSRVEWYTTHLFSFFVGIPQLINVFKAIALNIDSLFILSILVTAFTIVFNILSLPTYVPVIYEDEIPQQSCNSVLSCILEVYTSGAIGDDMESFQGGRFFFDLIYVVFIELLFQNLVGGIIIDAYGSLTAKDSEREEDKKGKCYICSKTKPNIQKQGLTFKKHTDKHFLWNYLYYIYCLENKDETDYTGIEYIIRKKIEDEDVSWFPQEGEEDNSGQLQELMNSLSEKIKQMQENEKKVVSRVDTAFEQSVKKLKKYQNSKIAVENVMELNE